MRSKPFVLLALVVGPSLAAAQPAAPTPALAPPTPVTPATPPPEPHATLLHVPVATAAAGKPIELDAVVDAAWAEPLLVVRYRGAGKSHWNEAAFRHSSTGGWFATIPADAVAPPGTEYYLAGRGPEGERLHFASEVAPHLVRVEPSEAEQLEAIDAIRTSGRTETVSLGFDYHDFGNRYGNLDRFTRGELAWSHRLSRTLYAIGFAFGVVEGHTPQVDMDQASAHHGARYGASSATVRLHRSVYVDARLILGVSHDGFMRGLAGTVTFGKPWRSNLAFSGEVLDDLGPSVSVRLQWDTVPGMLMGAAIVRTDLPGALIDSSGLLLRYDLTYQLDHGFALRGAVSYGPRDGAGNFGGGGGLQATF